jgi:hypothetical protein
MTPLLQTEASTLSPEAKHSFALQQPPAPQTLPAQHGPCGYPHAAASPLSNGAPSGIATSGIAASDEPASLASRDASTVAPASVRLRASGPLAPSSPLVASAMLASSRGTMSSIPMSAPQPHDIAIAATMHMRTKPCFTRSPSPQLQKPASHASGP